STTAAVGVVLVAAVSAAAGTLGEAEHLLVEPVVLVPVEEDQLPVWSGVVEREEGIVRNFAEVYLRDEIPVLVSSTVCSTGNENVRQRGIER
ncbi:hypothetical protein EDB89DRAFT_2010197, partial [Lactarius sanguifluus]